MLMYNLGQLNKYKIYLKYKISVPLVSLYIIDVVVRCRMKWLMYGTKKPDSKHSTYRNLFCYSREIFFKFKGRNILIDGKSLTKLNIFVSNLNLIS